jgi:hypothetical protein
VEVGPCHHDVSQVGRLECRNVTLPFCDEKTSQNRHLALDRCDIDIRRMSLRKLMFRLLCQRTNTMSEDSDADVMKVIVGKRRYIALVVRQGMAEVAAGLGIEQFPAAFGRVADSIGVPGDETVEG